MQYMLIFQQPLNEFDKRANPAEAPAYIGAWGAYIGAMYQAGIALSGEGLLPPASATSVSIRGGKRVVHDGPFADTKEHLAGYMIIDVPSLDDALEWAARAPCTAVGHTGVHPVMPRATAPAA